MVLRLALALKSKKVGAKTDLFNSVYYTKIESSKSSQCPKGSVKSSLNRSFQQCVFRVSFRSKTNQLRDCDGILTAMLTGF